MSKKNSNENAMLQFVTVSTPEKEIQIRYKRNPEYIEVKTKRVQLVMQPSLYCKTKEAAQAEGLSFNAYIHKVLEETLSRK
jgi:predicted DNA binding CopG/RHH family protein